MESCLVCYDRHLDESGDEHCVKDLYKVSPWKPFLEAVTNSHRNENYPHPVSEPKNIEKMIQCASILSKGFPVLRCDLYNISGKIYFGEMTFTPRGGRMVLFNDKFQNIYGNMVKI